jgi:hypothetical protein
MQRGRTEEGLRVFAAIDALESICLTAMLFLRVVTAQYNCQVRELQLTAFGRTSNDSSSAA